MKVSWRGKARLIRSVLRDRAVMSLMQFAWVPDRGWQMTGFKVARGGGAFVECSWDGGEHTNIMDAPWTTLPTLEADMIAEWVRCEERP